MQKFKLKKDDKVVGYCKWTEDWGWKYDRVGDFANTFTHLSVAQTPKGITAHPFVCLDKNGDEVYAGDKTNNGIAIAAFKSWVWTYTKDHSTYYWHQPTIQDIELIKE